MPPIDYLPARRTFIGGASTVGCSSGEIILLSVFPQCGWWRIAESTAPCSPVCGNPGSGDTIIIAGIKLRDYIKFQ